MTAEADVDDGTATEEVAPKRGPFGLSRRMMIIIGAAVGAFLAIGVASYLLFFAAPKDETHLAEMPQTFIFNLPTMTVNLKGDAGSTQEFMKLTVAIEVANEEVMTQIQPRMAKVIDAFQVYLRELRKSDLEGSAGIYRLREELRRRINVAIFPAQIESILFREILVQ
jgi:flagellar FliL protein